MKRAWMLIGLVLFLFVVLAACSEDEGESMNNGDSGNLVDGDEESVDDVDAADGDIENAEDVEQSEATEEIRLKAAAAKRTITPNDENHPCTKFMGGTGSNRVSEGVHDDLEARGLYLKKGDTEIIMVSLDLVGWMIADVDHAHDRLENEGIMRENVIIASTHTHTAPDTMGVWGEDWDKTGRCPEYADFLVDTVFELVLEMRGNLQPVQAIGGAIAINEPESNHPAMMYDTREPDIIINELAAAKFMNDEGETVATLVNWHNHPETMIEEKLFSADFPRITRERLEAEYGGMAVYFTGLCGGLMTLLSTEVPKYNEEGERIEEAGETVFVRELGEEKMLSMGHLVAEWVMKALEENGEDLGQDLQVHVRQVDIPFENLLFAASMRMGVLPEYDDMITDNPEFCGSTGCFPHWLHHIQLGSMHIVDNPGEMVPEMSVGRDETIVSEWDGCDEQCHAKYGEWLFPEIVGYRTLLPEGHFLMEFGLANNEIGYIFPDEDFHSDQHPDYYEEYFSISHKTAGILHEATTEILQDTIVE